MPGPILPADFLSRIVDEAELGIIVTELDGTIQVASPKILQLTGYTERDLIGAKPRAFRSGQTPEAVYKELWRTIRTGATWKGAILNRRKDGSLFLDRETIATGVGLKGNRACFIAIHRNADVELDLRLKVARAEATVGEKVSEIDDAKSTIKTLVTMTSQQAESTSHALIAALEARDPYTAGHGRRVSLMVELVCEELDLFSRFSRDAIRLGAILHDIGKVGIPDAILLKPGSLTEPEYDVIKTHPAIGFDILSHVAKLEETLRIVRHHHERLDGSGYPDGLRGHEIPDYVKAMTVCDSFDAMTSARAYRNPRSSEEALSILTDEALGGLVDMSAVKALKRLWNNGVLSDIVRVAAAA